MWFEKSTDGLDDNTIYLFDGNIEKNIDMISVFSDKNIIWTQPPQRIEPGWNGAFPWYQLYYGGVVPKYVLIKM